MNDPVKHPKHYEVAPGLEAIEVIRATLTPAEFRGYCIGNLLKYRLRAGKKDKLEQDIAKADTYAKMLEEQGKEFEEPAIKYHHPESFGVLISESEHAYPPATRDECGPLMDCRRCKSPC